MKEMLKTTPDEIRKIIQWQQSVVEHVDACLRLKKSKSKAKMVDESADFDEEQLIALAVGANKVLDLVLFNQKCYNGYDTLSELKVVKTSDRKTKQLRVFVGKGHPEFAEWRRKYYTRDLVID